MDSKKEREYADEIPDDEETARLDPYEETYRDGTAKNECWGGIEDGKIQILGLGNRRCEG